MKTVLLISHFPPPSGGIASWTKRLLEIGLPNDWNIDHVNSNTINGRDPFKNVKRNFFDEWKRSNNIWKKERAFLKEDKSIEVVHTCIPCTPFGMIREIRTGKIAKKYKKKFILHCRCTVPNVVNSKFKRFLFKKLAKICDGIIVLNEKSYEFTKKNAKCYVETIPNFASKSELIDEKDINKKEEIKNIVYVGGVTKEKGCDTIINAARIKKDITFNLVGIVSNEIKEMDIPNNVILHGNVKKDEIKKYLLKNDVFVFLSRYWGEGFSNALVEAMSAGLPCIVSDWAANKDMIENKGGIVIENNTTEDFIKAIDFLQNNSEFLKNASKWNIEKVKSSYLDDVITKKYVEFYEKIIN